MKPKNDRCDGDRCTSATGEVRLYPFGDGSNLILCRSCAAHENRYRFERGRDTGLSDSWPQVNWCQCEVVT